MSRIEKQILRTLQRSSSIWKIFREVDADVLSTIKTLDKLVREGSVNSKNARFLLTRKGKSILKRERLGKKIDYKQILKETKSLCKNRPGLDESLDQGYQRYEDIVKRVRFIYDRTDLQNTKILVLGDDASQSISLALTGLPKEIICLEIDERIVRFINKVARDKELKLKAIKYDVQHTLKLNEKFDVLITDPIESIHAIKLFLSRGIGKLKQDGVIYFTHALPESSVKKAYMVQKILHKMNFVITDIIRDFSLYSESQNSSSYYNSFSEKFKYKFKLPDVDYYFTDLIRAEAIGKPEELIKGEYKFGKRIYNDSNIVFKIPTKNLKEERSIKSQSL